jgi:TonB family protein
MQESNKILHRIALCAVLALLAGSAWGQKPQIVGQERPGTIQDWEKRIALAEERLRAGDFKKARSISEALVREMLHRIESGENAGRLMGQTLLLRALGAAGRNQTREALWDWHSARAMNPKLTQADLAVYGPAGEALREASEKENLPKKPDRNNPAVSAPKTAGNVTRPMKVKGEAPIYPPALRAACTQGVVTLEGVIDQKGHVAAPAPLESPDPILTLAALETLRTWRFKPATFRGKPVAVYYTLTIGFRLKTCLNPAAVAAQGKENG